MRHVKVVLRSTVPFEDRVAAIVEATKSSFRPPASWLMKLTDVTRALDGWPSPKMLAKALEVMKSHEWQYSIDGGARWVDLPAKDDVFAPVRALQPGTAVAVRCRPKQRVGCAKWSEAVFAVVP